MQRRRTGAEGTGSRILRALGFAVRALGAVAFVALVISGSVAGWRWVNGDKRFAVRHIEFSGIHRANEAELVRRSGLVAGRNIFDPITAEASAAMEQAPWVAHVTVTRALPDTLKIAVKEWEPAAVLNSDDLVVINKDGIRIKNLTAGDQLDLPILSGIQADAVGQDGRTASPELVAALAILQAFQASPVAKRAAFSELHVSEESGESVYTVFCGNDPPVEVRLGAFDSNPAAEMPSIMNRFERIWTELEREGRQALSIDLGNRQRPEWVPTRLAGAEQVPNRIRGVH